MKIRDFILDDGHGNLSYDWGAVGSVPEFAVLKDTPQNPKWHSEGSVWNHTVLVCEAMEQRCSHLPDDDRMLCMAAALFHDIGKGITTKRNKRGDWCSYNHDNAGIAIMEDVLEGEDSIFVRRLGLLVGYHMKPLAIFEEKNYLTKIMDMMLSGVNMYHLSMLKNADLDGSICEEGYDKQKDYDRVDEFFQLFLALKPHAAKVAGWRESHRARVIMMVGLPGSGKDTYIGQHCTGPEFEEISRDRIRIEMGLCRDGEKRVGTDEEEARVSSLFNRKLVQAVKDGKVPVINNTNLTRDRRMSFRDILRGYDIRWEYVLMETGDVSINKERRKGQMDPEVIDNMAARFQRPEPGEYDTLTVIMTGGNK